VTPNLNHIELEMHGSVLRAVIDRKDSSVNAVNRQLHDDLCTLMSWLRGAHGLRAVVLTGRGKAFSAGGDYRWFPELRAPGALEELRRAGKQLIWDMLDVEIPIIASVNGPAMGLGATIALLSDVVFMSEDAVIGDPHVRVGIVAGDGGTAIWPLALGPALAKRYLLTGDPVTAHQAMSMGLVTHVSPAADLDGEAMAFAQRLASGAPLAIRYTKLAVNSWMKTVLATAFDVATPYEIVTMQSDDHREALAAIEEGRDPEFHGH
jgi:enoyl-CoA hydratase